MNNQVPAREPIFENLYLSHNLPNDTGRKKASLILKLVSVVREREGKRERGEGEGGRERGREIHTTCKLVLK